jgi:hypothetical protein
MSLLDNMSLGDSFDYLNRKYKAIDPDGAGWGPSWDEFVEKETKFHDDMAKWVEEGKRFNRGQFASNKTVQAVNVIGVVIVALSALYAAYTYSMKDNDASCNFITVALPDL